MRAVRSRRPRSWGRGTRGWDPVVAAALYEELPAGVIACGREGTNLVFNRQARELFEGTGEALDPDDCAEHYGLYTAEGDRQLRTDEIPLQRALRGEQTSRRRAHRAAAARRAADRQRQRGPGRRKGRTARRGGGPHP